MPKEIKIYVVGSARSYANWIPGHKLIDDIKEADLVLFTGGEDVSPTMYDEESHPRTSSNSARDKIEVKSYLRAKMLNKKILGICRGSQFLCVMNGGKLVQHQDNPLFIHPIQLSNGESVRITSTHHQAQYPYLLKSSEYKLLGWTQGISRFHEDGQQKELILPNNREAEIVYYPQTHSLGIQGHPEMMQRDLEPKSFEYFDKLIEELVHNDGRDF